MTFDVYEMVNQQIIDRLEAGVIPWRMPWKTAGSFPKNLFSKRAYRGFNFWYLWSLGFERPYFLTFNQVQEIGASIRKGAKSHVVVFWKMVDSRVDPTTKIPYLRYYRVFHVDDLNNLNPKYLPLVTPHDHDFNPISECERVLAEWSDIPAIEYNKHQACYIPAFDKVEMPSPRNFYRDEQFYSVLFHELTHATGHARRLNRHSKFPNQRFGSADYSQEELVAEMGASYLCAHCGIENVTIDNSAAYIENWLSVLKNDRKFFLQACSYAQYASDYILGVKPADNSEAIVAADQEPEPATFF
jgi:antirestriction protein ArdC